jgi:hypothetical protein
MRRKPKPIRLKPKLKAWHKVTPALMAGMVGAFAARRYPFDCDLVRLADVIEHFGVSKEAAATFLRAQGATQLPRTTEGGGVPAITLWALRGHGRLMEKSARARVAIYLNHRNLHPFDPLEL